MDGRPTLIWLLIISLHSPGWVSGTFHGIQSGRRELTAGKGRHSVLLYNLAPSWQMSDEDALKQFMNVRSFPEGNKNCYTLRPEGGKGNKYLIRARFMYGNYDSNNHLPKFKLYLGTDEWVTVNIEDASAYIREEIIHVPTTDDIYVCLVNIGGGTPFISTLELRPLNNSIYDQSEQGSLLLFNRWDFCKPENALHRPDDVFDRIWNLSAWSNEWDTLEAAYEISSLSHSEYKLPMSVMMDAVIPVDIKTSRRDIREFTVSLNEDDSWGGGEPVIPNYMVSNTLHHPSAVSGSTTNELSFALKKTNRSTLPPLINAMEVYKIKDFAQSSTKQGDVLAVKNIRSAYRLTRHWQGDPCLPLDFPWDGLQCSYSSDSPTIISLNLSSSNLTGNIHPSFSQLKSLANLDLSYNNLTGTVPEFFADLPLLMVLNLTGNQLTGSVPQTIMEMFKDKDRTLSLGANPNLCPSVSCQGKEKKKKNRFLVPVLIAILTVTVILVLITALAMIIRKFKRRETKATTIETVSERPKEGSLKSGNSEFTFSDVASITNNFSRTIGRGGFGQVYLGTLADGTQVAVKMRSESSMQGPKALRAEVKLLTRVHHKNLVRLIGYCNDGTNIALVYEYMSNGNLQQKLSGRAAADVLNWKQRLQIAVDAAHGLEYLHNGCKPPIVHRDMKSSNTLLTETLEAKIADFGMSRDLESGALLSTDPVGTPGYLDPEYQLTGNLNKKSDVYSFGIVLLELITGQPAIKNPGSIHIVGWVSPMIERGDIQSIVDPRLQGDFHTNSAWKALEIALACVALTGMQRPDMSHVLADLKECLEIEMASRRTQSVSHSIGSGNFLEDSPLTLGTQSAPRAT
ncbi:putative leucine-rich repeat receptor-like protein kinase [Vitis vinifera]|uniref:non-specific serine/threonine protein kinase n=1 Tax=Vitis vinifera TaxID=29760 RepID=A0A438EW62_VITVI|nr:putative leucine-rich repeat receptor-like protein kinase [Vitis vinifera]